MSRLLYIAFFVMMAGFAWAQPPQVLFEEGNQLYAEQDYEGAIEKYEQIISQGYQSADVFFNMGNAHYKLGNVAPSILYYERALKRAPGNADIRYNLEMANRRVTDRIEPLPELLVVKWYKALLARQGSGGWMTISVILLWVALAFGMGWIFLSGTLKKLMAGLGITSILFAALFLLLAAQQRGYENSSEHAIVYVTNTYVKSEPNESATDRFIIREGVKVELQEKQGNWQKIKLANGEVGWVRDGDLVAI